MVNEMNKRGNRTLVGTLTPDLNEKWKDFSKQKLYFDKWVKAEMKKFEEKVKEKGKDIDEYHVKFWDTVYREYHLNQDKKYIITKEGRIYELQDTGNLLFDAISTFFDEELPASMSDKDAFNKLVHEFGDDSDIATQMLKERREYYRGEIKPDSKAD